MTREAMPAIVLFRVAAGPRMGFGHLVRSLALARALGVDALLSIRGGAAAARAARALGARVVGGGHPATVLAAVRPALLVIDDRVARETAAWRRAARRHRVPIASVHDLGIGLGDADLVVDGSLHPQAPAGTPSCLGPAYAVLRFPPGPTVAYRRGPRLRVLIALGGGPRRGLALSLARAIRRQHAGVEIWLASGLSGPASRGGPGIRTLTPDGFDRALATADIAVVAGGVTLYEACSLGRPCVAVSVVRSQRPTVEGFAELGAVVDGGATTGGSRARDVRRIARAIGRLLAEPALRRRVGRSGRRVVDGRGAHRVAQQLRRLVARSHDARGGR